MIQRVQTVWMILAAFAGFLNAKIFFLQWYSCLQIMLIHEVTATDNFLILILTSALGTGIIINIFLFKQQKYSNAELFLLAIVMECLIIFLYIRETNKFSTGSFNLWSAFTSYNYPISDFCCKRNL